MCLAVERMSLINNLSALGKVSIEELEKFSDLFIRHDNVEAILYHQITDGRLKVIKKLSEDIDKDAFEKVFQITHLRSSLAAGSFMGSCMCR